MQSFDKASNAGRIPGMDGRGVATRNAADNCAGILLETVPRIMRAVRGVMAHTEPPQLTVPQFRTLMVVHRHEGSTLSAVADALGLSLPSTSKLVDQLVRRKLLERHSDTADRRRMMLCITTRGNTLLEEAHAAVRLHLAGILNRFGAAELTVLQNALGLLQESFPSLVAARGRPAMTAGETKVEARI